MIEIKIFSTSYVETLFREVLSQDFSSYFVDEFPFEERFPSGPSGIFIPENIVLNPTPAGDIDSAIAIYEAFKDLNATQASDERLWVYLCHAHFWSYMQERWPIVDTEEDGKIISRIRARYFLRSLNLQTLTRNGICRLWWFAHLTYDSSNKKAPYELTRILLSRQDLTVSVVERALGSNPNIRKALLTFFKENPEIAQNENQTRFILKNINLVGGVKNLPMLTVGEIMNILQGLIAPVGVTLS